MSQSPAISPVVTVWCSRPRARWSLSLAAGATGHQSVGQSAVCKAPKSASAPGPPGSHYLCALVGMCLVFGVLYLVFGVISLYLVLCICYSGLPVSRLWADVWSW